MRILEEIQKQMRGSGARPPAVEPPPGGMYRAPVDRPAIRDPRAGGDEQRIQRLEQRMEDMMRVLENLQRRMGGSGGRGTGGDRERRPEAPGRTVPPLPVQPRGDPEHRREEQETAQPKRLIRVEDTETKRPASPAR
jgi:hypothetical protein